jgi:hypothetical protein
MDLKLSPFRPQKIRKPLCRLGPSAHIPTIYKNNTASFVIHNAMPLVFRFRVVPSLFFFPIVIAV